MFIRTLLFISFYLIFVPPAQACEYVPISFSEQMKTAEKVFIGTVEKVENKTATFKVYRGIKNIKTAESFTVEMVLNTCGIAFEPGQEWLYMGTTSMSGSRLLKLSNGHALEENVAFVKEKFTDQPTAEYDQENNVLILE